MLKISTPAFAHEAEIPMRYTQEAENLSPELVFSGVPANARSLVLLPTIPTPRIRRHPDASGCIGLS